MKLSTTNAARVGVPYRAPEAVAERTAFALVRRPRIGRVVAWIVGISIALVALVAVLAPWQQTAAGTGRVIAYSPVERQQPIEAPIEGRVVRWHVREGSRVRAGDLLVEIADNDPALMTRLREEREAVVARVEAAQARGAAIEARAASLQSSRRSLTTAAAQRVRMAQDRVRAAARAEEAAEATLRTARAQEARQRALVEQGLSSTRTVELAELDAVRARTELERARAALSAARIEEQALDADRLRMGDDASAAIEDARAARAVAASEEASARAELARIEVRLARQATQTVTAPRDGSVLRLATAGQGGEMVRAGDVLAVLVPDSNELAVELFVDGNDMPLLSVGRHVRLQFEGWPAVQFVGWPSVAVGTFGGHVALIDAHDDGKGKFRIVVVPDRRDGWPSGRYLRQGARANGWVLLDRVRLWYELWRQLNGFPPVVSRQEPRDARSPSR